MNLGENFRDKIYETRLNMHNIEENSPAIECVKTRVRQFSNSINCVLCVTDDCLISPQKNISML
jgi:hypothetical protein